jgi:phage terminase small subunit
MAKSNIDKMPEAKKLYDKGYKLIEISNALNIPDGTIRRWKKSFSWDANERTNETNERTKNREIRKLVKEEKRIEEASTDDTGLTEKQQQFCMYFVRCFNATKAYQKVYGCSLKSAMTNGSRQLSNDKVKAYINELKAARLNREFLTEADIFQKFMDIAFADVTDYLEYGRETVPVMGPFGPIEIKDPHTGEKKTLTKEVNVVKFRDSSMVDGTILAEVKQGKDGASIKLADRMKALEWLADHMSMATEEQKARIAVLKKQSQQGAIPDGMTGVVFMPPVMEAPKDGEKVEL